MYPNWNRIEDILRHGSIWTLENLDEEGRLSNLEEALEFGNHKGATEKPKLLRKLVKKISCIDTDWSPFSQRPQGFQEL